ncbi:betaine-aldehyde dehydrogenase [Alicyclobacillus sp. SO9]|nr:betaine-aldehyde dehydrogenase [Alicyclobacillus sp. SO9]
MYVDGDWICAKTGEKRDIINPFNQKVIGQVEEAGLEDVQIAVEAARQAFDKGKWPHLPAAERGRKLFCLAQLLQEERERFAQIETLNTGKTLMESLADMEDIANVFRYFAGLADKSGGEAIASPIEHSSSMVVREPVGVCAQITPWNYPLLQAAWKIAPALAAGCTVILKPSELTPLTSLELAKLAERAGIPRGVFNVLTGPGHSVGAALSESDDIDLVSFTGGGATGRKIMKAAAGNFKKIALELGGKNPNIVFADADFDTAVDYALNAVFFHAGQVCSAGARLLLENEIHDRFVEELKRRIPKIRLGDGFDDTVQMGPLISREHLDKVEHYVNIAEKEGASLVLGGKRPESPELKDGFFFEPTLFIDCQETMRVVQEETFGPILTVERFVDEEDAVRKANNTIYGLAGAVWTTDADRAQRVSHALRMGTVWINDFHPYFAQAPWGGYKQSGIGRELGHSGLDEYTELKHVFQNHAPKPMNWFGV